MKPCMASMGRKLARKWALVLRAASAAAAHYMAGVPGKNGIMARPVKWRMLSNWRARRADVAFCAVHEAMSMRVDA